MVEYILTNSKLLVQENLPAQKPTCSVIWRRGIISLPALLRFLLRLRIVKYRTRQRIPASPGMAVYFPSLFALPHLQPWTYTALFVHDSYSACTRNLRDQLIHPVVESLLSEILPSSARCSRGYRSPLRAT